MKKLLITAMALSCFALSYGQKKVEKQIIGKWCNPYTYKSTGVFCYQYSVFRFENVESG